MQENQEDLWVERHSGSLVRGILGLCSGGFFGGVATLGLPHSLMLGGIFVVPLLVAVFLEPMITGNPGGIPNTLRLVLGRLGIVLGLIVLEVVGCLVIARALPNEGSSDMRATLGCLTFIVFCISLAAPISASLATHLGRQSKDVV